MRTSWSLVGALALALLAGCGEPAGTAPDPPSPPPSAAPGEPRESGAGEPRELGADERAQIGRPYRYRLLTHCGIEHTWWNGAWWNADPPQSDGNGNPPPGWDNPFQDGIMLQVSATRLEFVGDQKQRADFVPRPPRDGSPPACD